MAEHFKPKSIYAQDVEKKRMEVNTPWRPSEQGLLRELREIRQLVSQFSVPPHCGGRV